LGLVTQLYTFWHSYGSDIQNGAVVLSAIAAFAVIRDSGRTAKRRGTMDLILHQESDAELIAGRVAFNAIKAGTIRPSAYGKPDKKGSDEAETIRKVLNIHELTAVAIGEGVIDECVYRRWFNSTYIADYEAMKDYMGEVRITHSNVKAFSEFERMAIRWRDDRSWGAAPPWYKRKLEAITAVFRA